MKTTAKLFLSLAFCFLMATQCLCSDAPRVIFDPKDFQERCQEFSRRLQEYIAWENIPLLEYLSRETDSLPFPGRTNTEWRLKYLTFYFNCFEKVDKFKELQSQVPLHVPKYPHVSNFVAGGDTAHIKDPKLRQEWENALELENQNTEILSQQMRSKRLANEWCRKVSMVIVGCYTNIYSAQITPESITAATNDVNAQTEIHEINTLLTNHVSNADGRRRIRIAVEERANRFRPKHDPKP